MQPTIDSALPAQTQSQALAQTQRAVIDSWRSFRSAKDALAEETPELWSTRLSLLGAALSLPALASLIIPSLAAASPAHIFSFAAYGVGLLAMFLASAAYHSQAGKRRCFLKNLDYSAIGIMIAGNFTPYCILALGTTYAYAILAVVWTIALSAATLRIAKPDLTKWVFIYAYLAMGWLGLAVAYPLYKSLGTGGVYLTVLGGVIYTAGTLIFNRNTDDVEPPGFGPHDVWHIFILAGAACHYLALRLYMVPLL